LLQAAVGLGTDAPVQRRRIARDLSREVAAEHMVAHLQHQIDRGGVADAVLRALVYIRGPEGKVDERGYRAIQEVNASLPEKARIGLNRLKESIRNQYFLMMLNEEQAVAAIPKLLPDDRRQRDLALAAVRRIAGAPGDLHGDEKTRLARIEELFASTGRALPSPDRQAALAQG